MIDGPPSAWPSPPTATAPPEARGLARDGVRMMVSDPSGDHHATFRELPDWLHRGDLLVVNQSATLPASLPASGRPGEFVLNLSTPYGRNVWLAEPRWSWDRPGPVDLADGEVFVAGGLAARRLLQFPEVPRLVFVRIAGDLQAALARVGRPIRYGYIARPYPLSAYQTIFGRVPGSAEMPSAGRPFSERVLSDLRRAGVQFAGIILHTGVSSLEWEDLGHSPALFPEPFCVPEETARAVRSAGGRVIAVGTTVVRALESAATPTGIEGARGYTLASVGSGTPPTIVDGMLTGFHDARATHLDLVATLLGVDRLRRSYGAAVEAGYLGHEFGDVHLMLRSAS